MRRILTGSVVALAALVEGTNRLIVTAHRNGIDEAACAQDSLAVTRIPAR